MSLEDLTQISLFDEKEESEEIVLTRDLKISEYMTTHIIKKNGVLYIKQQLKESKRWPVGHEWESENRPFMNEICEECFKAAYINELNQFNKCGHHGLPERLR